MRKSCSRGYLPSRPRHLAKPTRTRSGAPDVAQFDGERSKREYVLDAWMSAWGMESSRVAGIVLLLLAAAEVGQRLSASGERSPAGWRIAFSTRSIRPIIVPTISPHRFGVERSPQIPDNLARRR